MPPKRTPWEPRFWDKVQRIEGPGCWLWTGHTCGGYGRFRKHRDEPSHAAHRLAYELEVGPIPDGLDLDHVKARGCTNRNCVRPAHLEATTRAENLARADVGGWQRRKDECDQGHAFTPENTYRRSDRPGRRECITCRRAASRRHRANARELCAS